MTSSPEEVEKWWAKRNIMSKAETDFKTALKLWNQDPDSHQRVKAILLSGESKKTKPISTPEDLPKIERHHLIVLQDLSREWVEALGPRLGIPVSVFALHWANPIDHINGEVRVPIGESPTRHFILSYRQSLPFWIDRKTDIMVEGVKQGQIGDMTASESGFQG